MGERWRHRSALGLVVIRPIGPRQFKVDLFDRIGQPGGVEPRAPAGEDGIRDDDGRTNRWLPLAKSPDLLLKLRLALCCELQGSCDVPQRQLSTECISNTKQVFALSHFFSTLQRVDVAGSFVIIGT